MQSKPGWTPSGARRREYVESLKPAKLKAKEKKTVSYTPNPGFAQPTDLTGGYQTGNQWNNGFVIHPLYTITTATVGTTASNIILNQPYLTGSTAETSISGNWWPQTGILTGGTGITVNYDWNWNLSPAKMDPKEIAKQKWRQQLITMPKSHRRSQPRALDGPACFDHVDQPEVTALLLLKKMLSPQEWRRYITHGFIVVTGKTGLRYQILRGESHVRVFRRGDKVAELCIAVRYDTKCPPTDGVIARKIMVECDELSIWHGANIHQSKQWGYQYKPTERELVQLATA